MRNVALLLALLAFGSIPGSPCSLPFQPLDRPSSEELVFTARVNSVTDGGATAVLHLRDVHPVWPREQRETVDVAVYELTAACESRALAAAELSSRFPVGSSMSIVAEVHRAPGSGQLTYLVHLGGNSSIDPSSLPSDRFVLRTKLASLEALRDEPRKLETVRSLVPDQTGEVDLPGVMTRYVGDPGARKQVESECDAYWSLRGDPRRCHTPG